MWLVHLDKTESSHHYHLSSQNYFSWKPIKDNSFHFFGFSETEATKNWFQAYSTDKPLITNHSKTCWPNDTNSSKHSNKYYITCISWHLGGVSSTRKQMISTSMLQNWWTLIERILFCSTQHGPILRHFQSESDQIYQLVIHLV